MVRSRIGCPTAASSAAFCPAIATFLTCRRHCGLVIAAHMIFACFISETEESIPFPFEACLSLCSAAFSCEKTALF
jgi:hypothetical protein